jgi:diaminohydroxyphosphoribosylaminopyrimidine deaminase/5-amino-6-(5-phosphoribosylamino)uracil reductase
MGTMIHDKPRLTVREKQYLDLDKFMQPIAVVIESKKSTTVTDLDSALNISLENKLIFQQDIPSTLAILAKEYHINDVLLESGPGLLNDFLAQNLIDELIIYLAPKLLGKGAMNLSQFGPIEALTQSKDWVFQTVEQLGTDIAITAIPK